MTPKTVTPQELKAKEAGPLETKVHEIDCCPTCVSGIEPTTLAPEYLEILKR